MRLDKWLKLSRVIKRRTVANEICDQGRVSINDRPAKASTEVKPGDRLEIQFGNKTLKLEILQVPTGPVAAKSAPELYQLTGDVASID
ncbi:MAG TPA: RNA-binding S4 domain-containing protein [Stenomitos sp.]